MNYKLVKQLKNNPSYFIHVDGFVFKGVKNKEVAVVPEINTDTNDVFVFIDGIKMNLLYLMIEHFLPNIGQNQKVKFSHTFQNRIPLSSIKVTNFCSSVSDYQLEIINKFNCRSRADGANKRCKRKITAIEIAECLIQNNFNCIYCGDELNIMNWHLDHFIPVSKDGKNEYENIVPACYRCNMMKGGLYAAEFLNQCKKIIKNYINKQ